ncbi:MAG: primosomal protein N' [Nitrospirae bacterium]|nr:primosomal protein N' [Nitrospirota bacterium]
MTCIDIIFPINLGPLTYRCPEGLRPLAKPGMLVSAPLRKSMATGIIYRVNTAPPAGSLKDIAQIHGYAPVFSPALLKLIAWMSEYYLTPEGLVLKQSFSKEIFSKTKRRKSEESFPAEVQTLLDMPDVDLSELLSAAGQMHYQTLLLYAPSAMHEYSVATSLLRSRSSVIVLFPEISQAELFYQTVRKEYGERVCLLHSDMAAGRRSESIDNIISGKHDIIIGTRIALFAPMHSVSLILMADEHSSSYKLEEGIRFSVRDTAVMRGFLEKIPVILMSPAPSMDSWFNAQSGKYRLVRLNTDTLAPQIRIADLRFEKKRRTYLSEAVIGRARRSLKKNGQLLFIINRRGHATFLHCADCGNTESCPDCGIPLVLHKDRNLLECHYCARTVAVPDLCSKCNSPQIEQLGAGTQRIEEDLRDLFAIDPLRFDSDSASKKTEIQGLLKSITANEPRIIVATRMLTRRLKPNGSFSLAALLNVDSSLNIPDFRAREKTYQDIIAVRDVIAAKGEVVVQTRFPQDPLFKHLRDGNYDAFAAEELAMRAALNFPPYTKLLNVIAYGNENLAEKIVKILGESAEPVELLGPTEKKTKKGIEYSFLLRHAERRVLHAAARQVVERFKKTKGIEIRIDADPY